MPNESKKVVTDNGALLVRNLSGINNVTAEDRLTLDELREAVNVDITKEGRITRRSGREVVLTGEMIRGLWSPDGVRVFYATLNQLWVLDTETMTSALLFTGVSLAGTPAFVEVNGDIYWSDGVNQKIIRPDGSVVPWGVGAPLAQVAVTGTSGGTLEAGEYLVSVTCRTGTGEESGSLPVQRVTVPANGKIQVVGLLAPNDARITHFSLYLGTVGGKVLYRTKDEPKSSAVAELTTLQTQAAELRAQELVPMVPARRLVHYRGRIFALNGRVLYWTEPLRYGLTHPAKNYYVLPADGTVLAACEEGLLIAADKTYLLSGRNPDAFELVKRLEYGAPAGNVIEAQGSDFGLETESKVVCWMSHKGLVMGTADGQVLNLTQKRVAMTPMESATVALKQERGVRQVVASGKKTAKANRLRVGDSIIGEVRRNGVVVG